MTYPYGAQGAPAVGKGLGGLPRRNDLAFNEVIASYSQAVSVATDTTLDVPIPFSFSSIAELDVILRNTNVNDVSQGNIVRISGSPNGLAGRWNSANSATTYRTFQVIGNVLRITTVGATFQGRVQILRRNRRVRNFALLPVAASESLLPFAIRDVNRAMVTTNDTTTYSAFSTLFLHEYIPATETGDHMRSTALVWVRITSPATYITGSATPTTTITEFE